MPVERLTIFFKAGELLIGWERSPGEADRQTQH
jgi:hypothetical protein